MTASRSHDLVLFGATGFTGGLTAEYLARNAPPEARWALAGRNVAKLEAVRDRLASIDPSCAELPLLRADVDDAASIRAIAVDARVVITTVGPYLQHGEPLVAACANAGTDYVDLTGEPEFVDQMYLRHHERAVQTGARIVHACGFDSIPHDLGVLYTVEQLPEGVPLRVRGFVHASGRPSAGTYHSAINAFARLGKMASAARARRRAEASPDSRRARATVALPRRHGGWALPFPSIDPQIVARSARALDRYGPDFTYSHYAVVDRLPVALAAPAGLVTLLALAQVPPARRWLQGRMTSGEGPTDEQRAKSWFRVDLEGQGDGSRVRTEVSGGDPGYGETAKMLGESALCLALDDLPETSGQVTTAAAMGDTLIARLQTAGITFRTLERRPA